VTYAIMGFHHHPVRYTDTLEEAEREAKKDFERYVEPLYPASAISRLVKERDEKQAALQRIADEHLPHVENLEASVARLTALLAEADEVVKPFAEAIIPEPETISGWKFGREITLGDKIAARRYQQKREAK
jgi:hypothetical protein